MEEEQVKKKKKTIIVTIVTMALLVLIVGISYALWQQTRVQEGTNYIASGCFGVQFEGNNPISLTNLFPITTEDGMKTTPYTFTITNTCNGKAAYDVNLESLSNTTFQNSSIRVALDDTNKLYSEYEEIDKYYDDSIESRRLISGRLEANESVTYNLRIWIDEATPNSEQNKTFASKIVVNASEDFDDPEITDINATSTINSISITYQANGDISNTCKWGIEEGTYDNTVSDATNTNCNITGLEDNTTYYYQICTETGKGSKCETGNITTLIDSPEPSIINLSATSTHNSITITYNANGDVGTTCTYGTSTSYGSSASSVTNSRCSITGLNENTTYYYQVCTETRKGNVCKDGNVNTILPISSQVEIGDYVSMTPTSTSYTISKDLTGYTSDQTINPSELNLWRVIKKNSDGSVDMVSHYISSTKVYFYGKTGYLRLVRELNRISRQYTNGVNVFKTRYMGFSNQQEICTLFSTSECPSDVGYKADVQLVLVAYGDDENCTGVCEGLRASAYQSANSTYWLASRGSRKSASVGAYYYAFGRHVSGFGEITGTSSRLADFASEEEFSEGYSIRPVVTLWPNTQLYSGSGLKDSPYKLA